KHVDGKLTKKEFRVLENAGINPDKWADRFIKSFNDSGGTKGIAGGYRSQYHTWQDFAARNKMADAVRFMVRDTIIKRGAFDQPFIMNNPIMQTWFLFTGWGFAAFNRYTIPLLQRFEANQILGTVL